jgi:hypothetical protein
MAPMLSPAQYAARHEMGFRTVQRYLPLGRIDGAVQGEDGRWRIPADARVLDAAPGTSVVRPAQSTEVTVTPGVRPAYGGQLVPVADVAAVLGTSVHQVRRMIADGLLQGGTYGPRGSVVVFVR